MTQIKVNIQKHDQIDGGANISGYITIPDGVPLKPGIPKIPLWFFGVAAILIFTVGMMFGILVAPRY